MKLVVTGATGLIGSALVREAEKKSIEVVKLVRRAPKAQNESQWDPNKGIIDLEVLENSTAIVHLAGAGVGDHRWTKKYKKEILNTTDEFYTMVVNRLQSEYLFYMTAAWTMIIVINLSLLLLVMVIAHKQAPIKKTITRTRAVVKNKPVKRNVAQKT